MFELQLNHPIILSINEEENLSLEDAIECIFPLETEALILIWNNVKVPLIYKYDISIMVLDFIKIFHFIEDDESSCLNIHWASNTFATVWNFNKKYDFIVIKTEWNNVIGGTVAVNILNERNENILNKDEFRKEIKKILEFLKFALEQSGLNLNMIVDFEKLETCCR